MPVKTDRNDARGIAELLRLGWFRSVHCKTLEAQERRALLTARKLMQTKLCDMESSVRGMLRGFGLKVGKTTPAWFAGRIKKLVAGHPHLEAIAESLVTARLALRCELEKRVRAIIAARRRPAPLLLALLIVR